MQHCCDNRELIQKSVPEVQCCHHENLEYVTLETGEWEETKKIIENIAVTGGKWKPMLGSDEAISKTIIHGNMEIWKKIFGLEQNDYHSKMLKGSADCFSVHMITCCKKEVTKEKLT